MRTIAIISGALVVLYFVVGYVVYRRTLSLKQELKDGMAKLQSEHPMIGCLAVLFSSAFWAFPKAATRAARQVSDAADKIEGKENP